MKLYTKLNVWAAIRKLQKYLTLNKAYLKGPVIVDAHRQGAYDMR